MPIVAYYASWQYYDRHNLAGPRNLNYDMFTRINYAYFRMDKYGNVWGADATADPRVLLGEALEGRLEEACTEDDRAHHLNYGTVEDADKCACHRVAADRKECRFRDRDGGLIRLAQATRSRSWRVPGRGGNRSRRMSWG